MRRRAPRPLGAAVDALTLRLRPATALAAVQEVWSTAVGPAIAAHAQPVGEREGTVTVRCASSVWAQEVELLGPSLTAAVNRELGVDGRVEVRGLRCTTTTRRGCAAR
ncbi:MAG: DUF721 domain-containing protein [Solirubrobacterales bacterium]|nr:DUF721 domain-containing protein [Solirubrobacterales bacterium]